MKNFYPIFLDVAGKRAVVLGGGPVAARKAASLYEAGAEVLVISPELCEQLSLMAGKGAIRNLPRRYEPGDLAGAFIAVAATDDPETNKKATAEARAAGILINCVRPPVAGNFIVPSSIQRGGLTLAISTGGGCPALSKRLRRDLETLLGREYGAFLLFLEETRDYLKKTLPDEHDRQEVLTAIVESGLVEAFRETSKEEARAKGRELLESLISRYKA
jgi:precorrin-2 dehydrogenase/sirohydrochlorin ferrochelatase